MAPIKSAFRYFLTLLLLPLGAASAIPLAIGNTWVYERGISGKLDTLKALDTARCDSGKLWTLLWNRDTSRILERPNGRQSWLTGFVPNMEIEPESIALKAYSLYPESFGADSLFIFYWGYATEASHYIGGIPREFRSPQPRLRFSDSIGVLWVEGGCSTCKESESRTLRTFNGKDVVFSIANVMDSLPMGAGRLWEHSERFERDGKLESLSQAFFGWTVVSKLPDSAGWMRRRILQTEGASGAASRREVDWRWNLRGGDIVGDTSWWGQLVARGAAPKTVDSVSEDGRIVMWTYRSYSVYPYLDTTIIKAESGTGMSFGQITHNRVIQKDSRTLLLRWSKDSGCPCEVGVRPRSQIPSIGTEGMEALVRSHPEARVEWRDVSGRGGAARSTDAIERIGKLRGVAIVRVLLPTGIREFKILRP